MAEGQSSTPEHQIETSTGAGTTEQCLHQARIQSATEEDEHGNESDQSDHFEDPEEEFEVFDGNQARTSTVAYGGATTFSVSKPKVVEVPRFATPVLPTRNPTRLGPSPGGSEAGDPLDAEPATDPYKLPTSNVSASSESHQGDKKDAFAPSSSPSQSGADLAAGLLVRPNRLETVASPPEVSPGEESFGSMQSMSLQDIRKGLRDSPSPER